MKKNFLRTLSLVALGFAAVACSNPSKMAKEADKVSVESNPQILEVVANKIDVTYTINFPEKYFHPKAILEVVPVLVYEGGEQVGDALMLQGEKVTDNYKVVAKSGAQVSEKASFNYVKGVEKSHLELRCKLVSKKKGKIKKVSFDQPYKVADGANTTYMLVEANGVAAFADHGYQKVIRETKEAQILYLINNATVRPSQLNSAEIKEFQKFLSEVQKDERRTVESTDIIAYASPDGKEDLNTELSQKREKTASDAYAKKINKKAKLDAPVNSSSVSEDWEGFQELVENSDIQDKELILRVLSMYSDPMVREREIKNMSNVFKVLADKVLPQLRRARYIANIDYKNYTDEELTALVKDNIEILDETALLYSATLFQDNDTKLMLYKKAADKYATSRAYTNLAAQYLVMGKTSEAKAALAKVSEKCDAYYNNMGVVALRAGKLDEATANFSKSNTTEAKYNSAVVDILNGKYDIAAKKLQGEGNNNEALAYILTKQYDKASKVLTYNSPKASYLKAIVAARKGNAKAVESELAAASKNADLKARAEKDIEFAKYRK